MLPQSPQELENGNLKERILHPSNLVLSIVFLSNQSVGSGDLRNQLNQMVSERFINLYNILQKGHAAE